jgi:hypothetical protein
MSAEPPQYASGLNSTTATSCGVHGMLYHAMHELDRLPEQSPVCSDY